MAIITTKYAFGWYGSDEENCSSFDLSTQLGTYVSESNKLIFKSGSQDFDEQKLKNISIFTLDSGNTQSWTLDSELGQFTRDGTLSGYQIPFNKLECGRIYFISNPDLTEMNIPNFVPTAIDVDMGRINK